MGVMTNKTHKAIRIALLILLTGSLAVAISASFAPDRAYAQQAKTTITVGAAQTGKAVIPLGSTYKLDAKATSGKLVYKSSNPGLVSVSNKGVLKAVGIGNATVTVKSAKGKASKKVKVSVLAKDKFKSAKKLTLKASAKTLAPGEKTTLKVTFKPKKPSNANVMFKSSKPKIAAVSAKGVVTAVSEGTTKITATSCSNRKVKKTISVTVSNQGDNPDDVDGKIDLGDLDRMEADGAISVVYDEDGLSPRSIIGQFTDEKVSSPADAAKVLNDAAGLFSTSTDAEGNRAEGTFHVSPNEIAAQSASGDAQLEDETFYRFGPTKDGVPVDGSQIILSTDKDGNVTGLNSTYDNAFNNLQPGQFIGDERAQDVAKGYVSGQIEAVPTPTDTGTIENVKPDLAATSKLVIYADSIENSEAGGLQSDEIAVPTAGPFYAYRVNVTLATDGSVPDPDTWSDEEQGVDTDDDDWGDGGNPAQTARSGGGSVDWTCYIDAFTGELKLAFNNVDDLDGLCADEGTPTAADASALATTSASLDGPLTTQSLTDIFPWQSTTVIAGDLNGRTRSVKAQKYLWSNNRNKYRAKDVANKIIVHPIAITDGKYDYKTHNPIRFGTEEPYANARAISLLSNMEVVHDYYRSTLGRTSFDNDSAAIYIGYNDPQSVAGNNAYWSGGKQMFCYSVPDSDQDYAKGLDVMGHEFTHAVIDYVVTNPSDKDKHGLTYRGETGALNESYADIMGSIIEGKNWSDSGRWLLAEDAGRAIRNMADPHSLNENHPNNYSDFYTGTADSGGVHRNSGIFNLASYKMMNDSRTTGIKESDWARLFYRSMFRLSTDAKFVDARCAIIASANVMGFSGDQQEAIKDAFDAVGVTEPNAVRITLTWGKAPQDLDAHLIGPKGNGKGYFEASWSSKTYSYPNNRTLVASLDRDDASSYGPEIVTIHKLAPNKTYYFYVHDRTNMNNASSTGLVNSGAKVTVKYGKRTWIFNVDKVNAYKQRAKTTKGTYWNACMIKTDASGVADVYWYTDEKYRFGSASILTPVYDAFK